MQMAGRLLLNDEAQRSKAMTLWFPDNSAVLSSASYTSFGGVSSNATAAAAVAKLRQSEGHGRHRPRSRRIAASS